MLSAFLIHPVFGLKAMPLNRCKYEVSESNSSGSAIPCCRKKTCVNYYRKKKVFLINNVDSEEKAATADRKLFQTWFQYEEDRISVRPNV